MMGRGDGFGWNWVLAAALGKILIYGLLQKRDYNGRLNLLIADWMGGDGFGG